MQHPLTVHVSTALCQANTITRTWLRANTRVLTVTADILHSFALLTPSPNAEIHAQLAATLVALLQLYRDYPPPPSHLHPYPRRLLILNLITSVQLLVEMAASRTKHAQLPTVTTIEAAKAALRLSLLFPAARHGRQLTATDQQLPEAPAPLVCTCGMRDIPNSEHIDINKGPRTDRAILRLRQTRQLNQSSLNDQPPLSSANNVSPEPFAPAIGTSSTISPPTPENDPLLDALFVVAYERRSNWLVRTLMPDVRCESCSAVIQLTPPPLTDTLNGIQQSMASLQPTEIAAEVAYVMRPVLHLLLIRRFGWRSWKAWMLALLTDLGSRVAMPAPNDSAHLVERRRRMAQLLLYLGRSPLFDLVLRAIVKRITSPLRSIPLVGGVASSAIQWVTLLQQYWFYTSAS